MRIHCKGHFGLCGRSFRSGREGKRQLSPIAEGAWIPSKVLWSFSIGVITTPQRRSGYRYHHSYKRNDENFPALISTKLEQPVKTIQMRSGFGLSSSPVVYTGPSIRGLGLASRQGERGIDLTIEKHF